MNPNYVKPVGPQEALELKIQRLPPKVIETWNRVIADHLTSDFTSNFFQDYIVNALAAAMVVTREKVFESNWLDVEEIYRREGWKVTYDRPGFNETYKATFSFESKSRR